MPLPKIPIRGLDREAILIQGGMGAGVSLASLAGAVAKGAAWEQCPSLPWIGLLSSA